MFIIKYSSYRKFLASPIHHIIHWQKLLNEVTANIK
jgi:hypothetical protein